MTKYQVKIHEFLATKFARDCMKKTLLVLLTMLTAELVGCAMEPAPRTLNDTEKQLVKIGKEVRITGYQQDNNFSDYLFGVNIPRIKHGIYICATPISKPTADTPCYPQLSKFFGQQFAERGVKLAASRSGADAIVFATVKYDYMDVFAEAGDDYQKKIMDNMEQSLANGKGPVLSMKQLPGEEFYKTDRASIDKENKKERVEGTLRTAAYAAVAVASALMGQPGAGAQASEALRGATHSGGVQGSGIVVDKSEKVITISFHGLNLTQVTQDKVISDRATYPIAYIYKGPVNATKAFPELFNEALAISLKRFIIQPS
jgi:hypothetical protein